MRDQLRDLHPPQALGPKSWCTQGTHIATINMMVSWIAQCDGRTMWCKGLAGTGKSSLMQTLHKLFTMNIGGRSRLAAFIHYDHIGMAISLVVQTLPSVVILPPSPQFQFLLRNPLKSLPYLGDGGPLVVIIDGLDECDISNDMLAVLAEGLVRNCPLCASFFPADQFIA